MIGWLRRLRVRRDGCPACGAPWFARKTRGPVTEWIECGRGHRYEVIADIQHAIAIEPIALGRRLDA